MSIQLQGLIDRINQEGVQKADELKTNMLNEAKAEADTLIQAAKTQAAEMIKTAQKQSNELQARAEAAVNQAARDILLALRAELLARLSEITKQAVGEAMTGEVMAKIILQLSTNMQGDVDVVLPETAQKTIASALLASLKGQLKKEPNLQFRSDFATGFKIGFNDSDLYLDFSEEALVPLLCSYVGPKIAAILEKK